MLFSSDDFCAGHPFSLTLFLEIFGPKHRIPRPIGTKPLSPNPMTFNSESPKTRVRRPYLDPKSM